jgi:hypothetical protein
MKPEFQALAQRILNARNNAGLVVDGIFGPRSVRAAQAYLPNARPIGVLTPQRWVALVIQHEANLSDLVPHHVNPDAWWGPVTEDAAHRLLGNVYLRPDEHREAAAQSPAPAVPTPSLVRCWTPSDKDMIRAYGNPGSNQILAALPFPMRLAWDNTTEVTYLTMHRLFRGPYLAALEEIRDHYGLDQLRALNIDQTGGILNVRKKRGGTTWSAHAWGTAADHWPQENQLTWKRPRAAFARPEYAPMRDAFRRAGLMSLGECFDFDWMHWQLCP